MLVSHTLFSAGLMEVLYIGGHGGFAHSQLDVVEGKLRSLAELTKLILLDSLLYEVCISSVYDGSFTDLV